MDLSGSRHTRNTQLTAVARALGKSPAQLRQAVLDADGGSGAEMLTISVKVPVGDRRFPLKEDSLLVRTARQLGVDPRAMQEAITQSRPNAKPGKVIALGVRSVSDASELRSTGLLRYEEAKIAAAEGDPWALEYVRLCDKIRLVARNL